MSTTTRTVAVLAASVFMAGTIASGSALAADTSTAAGPLSNTDVGAIKAANDPAPFSSADISKARSESAAKDSALGLGGGTSALAAVPTSAYLTDNHVAQAYNNYCGPATARMTLLHQGANVSQATLASRFGISPNNGGTSWDAMLSALKYYGTPAYAGAFLAYSPSAADKSTYKSRMKTDIATTKDSLAGNVWEVVGGPHLAGHPNKEIFHWVNIRGYKESGTYSQVQDPATSVWSGVPANSPVGSDKLVTMMGGRGYQW
ncbi:C39 family peptidase [Streptomyces sp. NPDC050738]|uniref:C39 family peptidase n=1 Tax=Streptomyces sp. NPDC050738 TaxID=3154744 RepID=UPI003432EEE4